MGKIKKTEWHLGIIGKIGIFASFLLVTVFSVWLYSPVISSHADQIDSTLVEIGYHIDGRLTLTTDKNEARLIGRTNTFVSDTVNAMVSTNAPYGYSLSIEDTDSNTELIHASQSVLTRFTSLFNGAKTSSAMSDNTWGYSLNATDFYAMPEYGEPARIGMSNSPSPDDPGYNSNLITFGAKIADNAPAGVYSDTILLTAYINGPDGETYEPNSGNQTDLSSPGEGIVYDSYGSMQNFSCDDMPINGKGIVTDTRDGNQYKIRKLVDGNCWMIENLRLVDVTLTPEDSNVTSTFVLKASNQEDFGGEGDIDKDAVYYNSSEPEYGAYYTVYTATAGSSANVVEPEDISEMEYGEVISEMSSSVCPAGWRLPSYESANYIIQKYNYAPPYFRTDYGMVMYVGIDENGDPNPSVTPATFSIQGRGDIGDWATSIFYTSTYGVGDYYDTAAGGWISAPGFGQLDIYEWNNHIDSEVWIDAAQSFTDYNYGYNVRCMTGDVEPDWESLYGGGGGGGSAE